MFGQACQTRTDCIAHSRNLGTRNSRPVEDLLPPFPALTTDEEREKKAELHQPGTYHVIANPRSFESMPEYRDDSIPSIELGQPSPQSSHIPGNDINLPEGSSNVVILRTFEDTPRRASVQTTYRQFETSSSNFLSPVLDKHSARRYSSDSVVPSREHEGRDAMLLEHYRKTISPQIMRRRLLDGEEDIFILQAKTYPPVGFLSLK